MQSCIIFSKSSYFTKTGKFTWTDQINEQIIVSLKIFFHIMYRQLLTLYTGYWSKVVYRYASWGPEKGEGGGIKSSHARVFTPFFICLGFVSWDWIPLGNKISPPPFRNHHFGNRVALNLWVYLTLIHSDYHGHLNTSSGSWELTQFVGYVTRRVQRSVTVQLYLRTGRPAELCNSISQTCIQLPMAIIIFLADNDVVPPPG